MNKTFGGASTIDEVLLQMDELLAYARQHSSRLGLFAALYRTVTRKVKEGILTGYFEDGPRMERLDVIFANRYLEAASRYLSGEQPTGCWALAFEQTENDRLIILQHLLLGMNAHINYDLGIAAAAASPGEELAGLHTDFNRINAILASLVSEVLDDIQVLSPWIGLLDHIDTGAELAVIHFSMTKARDCAWHVAEQLVQREPAGQALFLAGLDSEVTALGHKVANPGFWLNLGLGMIRSRETSSVPDAILVLGGPELPAPPGISEAV